MCTDAVNTKIFISFIDKYKKNIKSIGEDALLVMNSVGFHKTEQAMDKMEMSGINYKYLPPYSPYLNPIDNFFSVLKPRYSNKNRGINTKSEMINLINEVMEEINRDLTFGNFLIECGFT